LVSPRLSVALLLTLTLVGCQGVLDVEQPGRIPAERLDDPLLARALVNGVIGDVECAWDGYMGAAAWISDQYEPLPFNIFTQNLAKRNVGAADKVVNESTCDDPLPFGTYIPLQIARVQAEDAVRRLETWTDQQVGSRRALQAKVRAYGAYAYLALGEGFDSVTFGDGRRLPPDSALARAENWFSQAIQSATNDSILNLARVGRARVRLDRRDLAGAAADAALVPPGFRLMVSRGTEAVRRNNQLVASQGLATIAQAYRALTVQGVPDPRVPVTGPQPNSQGLPVFITTKYAGLSSPHRLASYKEAQYILAEAVGGQTAVGIINALRDSLSLPRFAGGTPAQILAQILEERAREFFAEGSIRYNDLLRHNLAWKTGVDPILGDAYGTTRRFPMPRNEILGIP
jgi:hypothetical protein